MKELGFERAMTYGTDRTWWERILNGGCLLYVVEDPRMGPGLYLWSGLGSAEDYGFYVGNPTEKELIQNCWIDRLT